MTQKSDEPDSSDEYRSFHEDHENSNDEQPQLQEEDTTRRSQRQRKAPGWHQDYEMGVLILIMAIKRLVWMINSCISFLFNKKVKASSQTGKVSPNHRCHRCQQGGHWHNTNTMRELCLCDVVNRLYLRHSCAYDRSVRSSVLEDVIAFNPPILAPVYIARQCGLTQTRNIHLETRRVFFFKKTKKSWREGEHDATLRIPATTISMGNRLGATETLHKFSLRIYSEKKKIIRIRKKQKQAANHAAVASVPCFDGQIKDSSRELFKNKNCEIVRQPDERRIYSGCTDESMAVNQVSPELRAPSCLADEQRDCLACRAVCYTYSGRIRNERSILPKYYTRVPQITRSQGGSSSLVQDCASNSTLLTNVSPFTSQAGLSYHDDDDADVLNSIERVEGAADEIAADKQHYYAENLRNNQQLAVLIDGSKIYDPLKKDHREIDYKQVDPLLLRRDEVASSDTRILMESQDFKDPKAAMRLTKGITQFEKEKRTSYFWTQILMRADTHVNIEVPGNAPVAKCTFSQVRKHVKSHKSAQFRGDSNIKIDIMGWWPIAGALDSLRRNRTYGSLNKNRGEFQFWLFLLQVLAAFSVSLGSMVVGFASSYTSPALTTMKDRNITSFQVDDETGSWIGSLMPLSALFGGIAGGPLIEYIGRRNTILFTAFPFIFSWLLIGLAVNVVMILLGRMIGGFAVGVISLSLPVYLGETIQPEVRGSLGLLPTAFGNIGILLCFTAGMYLDWWRLALLGALLPVPFALCMIIIPETPRWYISKGKTKRARKSLQWLRGKQADVSEELTTVEKMHVEAERQVSSQQGPFGELFKDTNLKPLLISLGLMFFQQMSGINAVIFYTVQIFEVTIITSPIIIRYLVGPQLKRNWVNLQDAGSKLDPNISTIIVGIVNFGSTFVATTLIDRLGRKILLYVSSVSMIVSLASLGAFFFMKNHHMDVSAIGWLPLTSFVVYVIGFSLGFGPIPWLMMGEILPAKIRGSAASVATSFNWTCTFVVTKCFMNIVALIGQEGTFWLFMIICLLGLVFVIGFVPETSGRSLEEIERGLTGPVRRMSAVANIKPTPMAC
ncbi:unnamed protein product [Trichogramma brassicae]|uniref:Major facilitator superfamily (MFS) profile domain-containing protein n=1 Tax=Trichogramma brassicae TaxID=86971 RepID=A0A6H5IYQ9_9HYME|nr:unnamed protein product [Trichogramma brassicae]